MDNTITFSAIVGFFLPAAIAVVNRERWSSQIKGLVAFAVCLLAALATVWYEASVDWHDYRRVVIVVFGVAIGTYRAWWHPSGLTGSIETKTG